MGGGGAAEFSLHPTSLINLEQTLFLVSLNTLVIAAYY